MKDLRKNYLYNSIYQIFSIIVPLLTTPYVSRVMGPSGIGMYSYTHSISHYFVLFSLMGVNNYGNRSIAKVREDKENLSNVFWGIYYLQLLLSIVFISIYIIFIIFLFDNKFIFYIQIMYVVSAMFNINWFLFGIEEFKVTVVRDMIVRTISVGFIFIFVKNEGDLWIYTTIMTLSVLLSQLVVWPYVLKRIDYIPFSFTNVIRHLKPNFILFIPVITVSIYKYMDKIMLGRLSSINEVGLYTNAEQVINIPMGLITALGTVMLPRMSNLVSKGYLNTSKVLIKKSMLFTMFLSSALSFGIAGIAPTFAPWFFGHEFAKSGQLIVYLSVTILFISWSNVIRTQYLLPNNKENILIISVASGAVINFGMNLVLIPMYGAIGAVIGTIFAEATVCIIQTYIVKDQLELKEYFKKGFMFLINGFIMFFVVRLFPYGNNDLLTLIVKVFIGALIYIIISFIYIKKNNIRFINRSGYDEEIEKLYEE